MINQIRLLYNINKSFIKKTPLKYNERLSKKYNCNLYLKREDLQKVRSFKIRGAYTKLVNLSKDDRKRGVVCASAGNHAQGVALSCNKLGIVADIFVPENTPLQKIRSIERFSDSNCKLHITGDNFDNCLKKSLDLAFRKNKIFVHPFNDDLVIKGQAGIALEIFEDINPDVIIGCVGGGGLMSGVSVYSKYMNTECNLYGVESLGCDAMNQSIKNNKIIKLDKYDNFVDGSSVKEVGDLTFNICQGNLKDILLVSNGHVCNTMLELYNEDGIISEPAGALSVSALDLIKDKILNKNVVAIISGGNNDISRYPEMIEYSKMYLGLKHYFLVKFVQKPGELKKFINNVLTNGDDITRFEYLKKTNKGYGTVLIGIELENAGNLNNLTEKMEKNMFNFEKIEENDLLYSYLI